MQTRFLVFIGVISLFLIVSGAYLALRCIQKTSWGTQNQIFIWSALGVFVALQILGPLLNRLYPNELKDFIILNWVVYVSLGLFFCTLVYSLISDLLSLGTSPFLNSETQIDFERRKFLGMSFAALGSSLIGIRQARTPPRVEEIEISLKGLPRSFDGYRIVQITDLHVGPTIGRDFVASVVERANTLDADLVALTGDFVDGLPEDLKEDLAPLKTLRSRDGVFFVTGNHEYYWGVEKWIEHFQNELGCEVLLNEHRLIQRAADRLLVAGVTDFTAGSMLEDHRSDPHRARGENTEDLVKILLAHQPKSYQGAHEAGFDLQISGHTHAGQFFPFNIFVKFFQPYYRGLNRHENLQIYVSRGTGYWGPPMRFLVPSEVSLIQLRSA